MVKCTKCGGGSLTVVERVGSLETWRCEFCSHEETVHVYSPSHDLPLPKGSEPVFRLVARWNNQPTVDEIDALRALFPRLRAMSAPDLAKAARTRDQIELGRFTDSELKPLTPQLESLDICLDRIPIATP